MPKRHLDEFDLEAISLDMSRRASRRRVGNPCRTSNGAVGKRTGKTKRNYRKTAPATAATTEIWANRGRRAFA